MSVECPHGNIGDERCAQCIALGEHQPDEYRAQRFVDAGRVERQSAADDDLLRRANRQAIERRAVAAARRAAQWSRQAGR